MNTEQLISFQSWYLRLLPITLPFAAILTATVAFANRAQDLPSFDMLVLVLLGGTVSGLLPLCFVLGVFFLIANALHEPKRHYYFAISFIVAGPVLMYAYQVGRNLYL